MEYQKMEQEITEGVGRENSDIVLAELLSALTSDFERGLLEAYMAAPSQSAIEEYLVKYRSNIPEAGGD
jgi:hypothetical protein